MTKVDMRMGGLSLEDDQDEGLCLWVDGEEEMPNNFQLCLVGRLLTDRPIRTMIMKERMMSVWRSVKGVVIKEVSPGLFLFHFFQKRDLDSVVKVAPGHFDNYLLILGRMQVGVAIQRIPLHHVEIWVQAYNITVGFMTELVRKHLGNYIK